MALALNREIPPHVPPHLIMELPLFARADVALNPHEVLVPEMHRTLPPLCYIPNIFAGGQPAWLLKSVEDVHGILRDSENFTKNGMGKFAQSIGEDWNSIPTETDPPVHAVYRQPMNPVFAPSKMLAMRAQLRERARTLIDAFKDRGECDFIKEFAEPYPIYVVLDLLGLPRARMSQFRAWVKVLIHGNDWDERTDTMRMVRDYLLEEIDQRYACPRDDYMSQVLNFRFEHRAWTRTEVLGHCFNLFLGGLDTVTGTLGNLFRFLAANPAHQAQLRNDPALIPMAVEELMRAYPPVTVFRVVTREIRLHGERLRPGDYVTVCLPLLGRDPAYYDSPDDIRFDRKPRHASFGDGIHRCLGIHLARLELQTAFEEFFAALAPFRIKDGLALRYATGVSLHTRDLRLQWDCRRM